MSDHKIVYSDDPNFKKWCKKCGKFPCRCEKPKEINPQEHVLKLRVEKNGRGGKIVTVIFVPSNYDVYFLEVAKKLKNLCGSGGTYKEGKIEIQGDHLLKIKFYLESLRFKTKGS